MTSTAACRPGMRDLSTLEATANFRDLGGIVCADARPLRAGRVLRSGELAGLSLAELHRVSRYPLAWVCDLRSAKERAQAANDWPASHAVRTLRLDDGDGPAAARPAAWRQRLRDPAFDAAAARAYLLEGYRRMPAAFAGILARLFETLSDTADADAAILIHCVAGKDRTGFVCAMLLLALGASPEAIHADYLASRSVMPRAGRPGAGGLDAAVPDAADAARIAGAIAVLSGVDSDYLDAAYGEAERCHGSVDAYLSVAASLTDARRDSLRARLLARP